MTPGCLAAGALCVLVLSSSLSSMQSHRVVTIEGSSDRAAVSAVVAGGLVYVAGVTAPGTPDDSSDVQAEARRVLGVLDSTLRRADSSLASVVNVNLYLKRAADFDAVNGVYREFFSGDLPARTTVVVDLPGRALVQMSAIAAAAGTPRDVLHPAGWMKSPRPYSYIVRAGGLVFLSGLVSRRPSDDQVVPGPVALQTKTVLENAGTLLRAAGLSYADVVSARVFVTDDSYFEAMNDEYRRYFGTDPPARATTVAGLMGVDALVEITLVASDTGKQSLGPTVWPTLPVAAAVRAGNRLFLSGVMGNTATNRDDAAAQTKEVLTRMGRTLEGAGYSPGDIVDLTAYVPDSWGAASIDDVLRTFFPGDLPARTVVGAKLIGRDAAVELMATAVK
jgi:2-iminobutanoate/2-iminopropanoate deaminase